MVDETADSGTGLRTTVRAFAFDGNEVRNRSEVGKTLALASLKGFLLTLVTKESTGTALTVEQFECGEVQVTLATAPTTGGGSTGPGAAVMHPTTAAENRKYLATRAAAWTYLVASCTDKACCALIERCKGDPSRAWSILQEKYCATDVEENCPKLDQAFNNCKFVRTKKDAKLCWFNDLDHLNMQLTRINFLKYQGWASDEKSHDDNIVEWLWERNCQAPRRLEWHFANLVTQGDCASM